MPGIAKRAQAKNGYTGTQPAAPGLRRHTKGRQDMYEKTPIYEGHLRKEIYEKKLFAWIGLVLVQRLASTHLGVDLLDVLALGERALVGAQL